VTPPGEGQWSQAPVALEPGTASLLHASDHGQPAPEPTQRGASRGHSGRFHRREELVVSAIEGHPELLTERPAAAPEPGMERELFRS